MNDDEKKIHLPIVLGWIVFAAALSVMLVGCGSSCRNGKCKLPPSMTLDREYAEPVLLAPSL